MNGFSRRILALTMPLMGACGEQASTPENVETSDDATTGAETIDHNSGPSSEDPEGTQPAASSTTANSSTSATEDTMVATSSTVGETFGAAPLRALTALGARCHRAERLGALGVNLAADRTIVSGAVSNGVLPSSVPKVAAESGTCELLVPRDLFCSSCESNQACAGDDECVAKPTKVSAGALSVDGLATPVEFEPNGITLDYSKTVLDPFPAFNPGDAIGLSAAGDVTPPFEAELTGVAGMVIDPDPIAVKYGEPAGIVWDATAADADASSVFITFSVNVHGAVTGWIECTAPDTGEFEIPAELVSALIDLGLSGFPSADIERRSSATVDLGNGCLELYVGSKVTKDIALDGLASCHDDADCDSGQTCSDEMVCE